MSLPKEMKAIIFTGKSGASVKTIPLPTLRPTYLLIKVESVALNPTDWKGIAMGAAGSPFCISGCDYAGTVLQVGSDVTKSFKEGDKVYGCVNGASANQPYDGAFAEYAVVKGDVTMHAPKGASMEDLSTVPLGAATCGQGLFQPGKALGLALPESGKGNGEWLLIYGGSTATGSLGVQLATLAGYKVITTCSPKNNDFVKSLGAAEVFDYNDPECGPKIRKLTDNKLKYAWDTHGADKSPEICDQALSSDSSICHYAAILQVNFPRKDIQPGMTLMYTMFGEPFMKYGMEFPALPEDYEFAKPWMSLVEKLVAEGKLKPHPKDARTGGLAGVLEGLEDLKAGKVSRQKLVYSI